MAIGIASHCLSDTEPRACPADRRYYGVGGITVQLESDLPFGERTFADKLRPFEVDGPGSDTIMIRHHFGLPDIEAGELGPPVYHHPPWAVYRTRHGWVYLGILPGGEGLPWHRVAVFNADHSRGDVYHPSESRFFQGGADALTFFPTDQILLARVLADRQACLLHAAAAILDGEGLLFVGHSGAGKSTVARMLQERAEILCDDRNIVRRQPEGLRLYGTWSHGEVPRVSAASAPLRAICLLRQSARNRLAPIADRGLALRELLACLIRPVATADWWDNSLALLGQIAREASLYEMHFETSGEIVRELESLVLARSAAAETPQR